MLAENSYDTLASGTGGESYTSGGLAGVMNSTANPYGIKSSTKPNDPALNWLQTDSQSEPMSYANDVNTPFTTQYSNGNGNGTLNSLYSNNQQGYNLQKDGWWQPNAAKWSYEYTPGKVYENGMLSSLMLRPEILKYLGNAGLDTTNSNLAQAMSKDGSTYDWNSYVMPASVQDPLSDSNYMAHLSAFAGDRGTDNLTNFLNNKNWGIRAGNEGDTYISQLYDKATNQALAADVRNEAGTWMQRNGWMIPLAALGGIAAMGPTALGSGAVGAGSTAASIGGVGISAEAGAGLGSMFAGSGADSLGSLAGEGSSGLGSFTMPQGTNLSPLTGEALGGTGASVGELGVSLPSSQYWSMNNPIIKSALTGALKGGATSALTGGNPLTGALLGGLTGGAGQGLAEAGVGSGGLNSSLLGALAGTYLGNKTNNSLQGQITNLQQLFGPNSAYATQLRQELDRKDAAAGRRSQYGPREVELQARLAQLASGQAGTLNNLYNQQNANRNLMLSTLLNNGAVTGGASKLYDSLFNSKSPTPSPEVNAPWDLNNIDFNYGD